MQLENLARAGAFDTLDANRARVFAGAETDPAPRAGATRRRTRERPDRPVRRAAGRARAAAPARRAGLAADGAAGLEAEAIGFHLTAHPLDAYAPLLRRLGVVPQQQVEAARAGRRRRGSSWPGCVVGIKERTTRTGSRMAWVRLSDAAAATR